MTASIACLRLNGAALLSSSDDAFIHVARRAMRDGLDASLCGQPPRRLRLMAAPPLAARSYVLCPACMGRVFDAA